MGGSREKCADICDVAYEGHNVSTLPNEVHW